MFNLLRCVCCFQKVEHIQELGRSSWTQTYCFRLQDFMIQKTERCRLTLLLPFAAHCWIICFFLRSLFKYSPPRGLRSRSMSAIIIRLQSVVPASQATTFNPPSTLKALISIPVVQLSRLVSTLAFLQTYHARRFALQTPNLLPELSVPTEPPALPSDPSWVAAAPPALASVARRALRALHTSRVALNDVITPPEKKESAPARQQSDKGAKGGKRVSEAGKPKPAKKGDKAAANEPSESPETAPEAAADPEVLARKECARALLAAVEEEGTRATERLRQLAEAAARDMEAVKEMEARALARLEDWIAERFKVRRGCSRRWERVKHGRGACCLSIVNVLVENECLVAFAGPFAKVGSECVRIG